MKSKTEKKTLLYYKWFPDLLNRDYSYDMCDKIHDACLSSYSNIFDEAIFIIAVDSMDYMGTVTQWESKIIGFGYHNVTFKIVPNLLNRESEYIFSELINKLDSYEGAVFFAHSKGSSNYQHNPDSIEKWIMSMYYFNLNDQFQDKINWAMFYSDQVFQGVFKCYSDEIFNKYHYMYAGTFFWVNPRKLNQFMKIFGEKLPECVYANSSENFPGNVISPRFAHTIFHELNYLPNLYDDCDKILHDVIGSEKINLQSLSKFYHTVELWKLSVRNQ